VGYPTPKISENDFFVVRDLLDKQIVDIEDRKLIRVQDIDLGRTNNKIYVLAIDVSFSAILRRLGLEFVTRLFKRKVDANLIDWKEVNLIGSDIKSIKLKVTQEKLSLLHPADIADIVSELSPEERTEILESMDEEVAADTLEEMEDKIQTNAMADMDAKRASEILSEMNPDNAADLLADLSKERAGELLSMIKRKDAIELRGLLSYPEESAGGIMTTEFITMDENATAKDALKKIREIGHEIENFYYIYVVDRDNNFIGVFTLKELILSEPAQNISAFMSKNLVKVHPLTPQKEVAKLIAKYNLIALPVVDEENHIKGIVTVDDAIDIVIPTAWKKRLPRLYG
jgi:Mg2+ transporter MgtE